MCCGTCAAPRRQSSAGGVSAPGLPCGAVPAVLSDQPLTELPQHGPQTRPASLKYHWETVTATGAVCRSVSVVPSCRHRLPISPQATPRGLLPRVFNDGSRPDNLASVIYGMELPRNMEILTAVPVVPRK